MRIFTLFSCLVGIVLLLAFTIDRDVQDRSIPVNEILTSLGYNNPNIIDESIQKFSREIGEDIVKYGFSKDKGKKSKKQSKHFVCTSCHNIVQEDPDLAKSDPQARLDYAVKRGIPFLQGSSLYGIVNRESFYNDDYESQYGDLVTEARDDIRKSIQLCATECAQGRALENWEIESILSYMWTLELKMEDLILDKSDYRFIFEALDGKGEKSEAIELIRSKYLQGSPATFNYPPEDRKAGYEGIIADPNNGASIYEQSCLHCHFNQKYSYLHLDKSKMSMKWLNRKAGSYSRHSIYQVVRYGVDSHSGKRSYMPKYPTEKMSDQQVEDLKAYFQVQS